MSGAGYAGRNNIRHSGVTTGKQYGEFWKSEPQAGSFPKPAPERAAQCQWKGWLRHVRARILSTHGRRWAQLPGVGRTLPQIWEFACLACVDCRRRRTSKITMAPFKPRSWTNAHTSSQRHAPLISCIFESLIVRSWFSILHWSMWHKLIPLISNGYSSSNL
jgi:hypothetical protein